MEQPRCQPRWAVEQRLMSSSTERISKAVKFLTAGSAGYLQKWLTLGVLIGIVSGVGSILFYLAINWVLKLMLGLGAGYVPPVPGGEGLTIATAAARNWAIPISTALGGLISGLIVFKFAPEAEGHGTDAAINAFHNKDGVIRKRVPVVKLIASAITIGSGGSAGREGPVALIGAGFGSVVADVFKLNRRDRRIALAVGIGSGVGSIFKAPLGGAILSSEILYRRDFEFEALLPSFVASIVGYSIFGAWNGWTPIFLVPVQSVFQRPTELIGYAILGIACGLLGRLYGWAFYRVRGLFRSLKVRDYLKPAIGGLLVGVAGMFLPQVLGMGYGWIQFAINGDFAALPLVVMGVVVLAKIVATSLSIGSGGSGGVFAPGLVIGAMLGGTVWSLLKVATPIVPPTAAGFVIVGMMALFGGIAKAPLAIMIMVSEMTGNYNLLVPCMISVVIAYFLTGDSYIYENQVNSRADSPAHRAEYSVPLLKKIRIGEAMVTTLITAPPESTVSDLDNLMKARKIDAVPIVSGGRLEGIVAVLDIARVAENRRNQTTARDIMTTKLKVGYADEYLYDALVRMTENNVSHLPIVDPARPGSLVGLLAFHDIAVTYETPREGTALND